MSILFLFGTTIRDPYKIVKFVEINNKIIKVL